MGVKFSKDLRRVHSLIPSIKKEYASRAPSVIKRAIRTDMSAGVSPVKGKRWQAYSDSYRKAIASGRFQSSKSVAPVNLRLTGDLRRSLFVRVKSGGFFRTPLRLEIGFDDFKADIHNRLGASKRKVIRRMLPTKTGETFNRKITKVIFDKLKDSVKSVVQKLSRR